MIATAGFEAAVVLYQQLSGHAVEYTWNTGTDLGAEGFGPPLAFSQLQASPKVMGSNMLQHKFCVKWAVSVNLAVI